MMSPTQGHSFSSSFVNGNGHFVVWVACAVSLLYLLGANYKDIHYETLVL